MPPRGGGGVLKQNDNVSKEWGYLRAQGLDPLVVSYKTPIHITNFQGERPGAGVIR